MPLFYDTETSGKYNFKLAPDAPGQPKLMQLAFILDDEEGETISEYMTYVKISSQTPIEPGALRIHGITHEKSQELGIAPRDAMDVLRKAVISTKLFVAHNWNFDSKIIESTCISSGFENISKLIPNFCTMFASTPVLKIPGRYGKMYKWPTLDEAYRALVDTKGFLDAHDALADTKACRAIFYSLKEKGLT